jgi:4'-phosphopantetheinyl transferase
MMWPLEGSIGSHEVHIWWFSLDQPAWRRAELESYLSRDERERMQRLVFEHHRRRFVVARGVLRSLLGVYRRIDPAQLRFNYTPFGKPSLEDTPLAFNISHSVDVAVCAITIDRALGVDVEAVKTIADMPEIMRRHAAPREQAAYWMLPSERRVDAFYHWWVRKEAYVKALGTGLSESLSDFAVTITPDEPIILDSGEARGLTLRQLTAPSGYAGCVAVEGSGWRLVERTLSNYVPPLRLPSEDTWLQPA